ncbi:hypothetical protein [Mycolicibacterium cosmeticum]|uniref:hypothetical protein n=1 Tax=Mycolicibacterium cosmeticum TaxID=258533 RepID=UPI00320484BB
MPDTDWFKLFHIGAHGGSVDHRPDLADLGLGTVHGVCDRVWAYSRSDFEPDPYADLRSSQWRETCALAGSMAESLMVCAATMVEVVWHAKLIEHTPKLAGMALAQRFLADTVLDTSVSVGHRLVNFVVRVARTDPAVRDLLGRIKQFKKLGATYQPFATNDPGAWLSYNEATLTLLRTNLPEIHWPALHRLEQLRTSPEWSAVLDIRGENAHRWRKEHEAVRGVDAQSGYAHSLYDYAGKPNGFTVSAEARRHAAGDGLTMRTTDVALRALPVIATALDETIAETLQNLAVLTNDRMRLQLDERGEWRIIHRLM